MLKNIVNKIGLSIVASALLLSSVNADDFGGSSDSLGASSSSKGEKSGAFLGVSVGASLTGFSYYDNNDTKKDPPGNLKKLGIGVNAGLKVGYNYFFVPLFGIRGYLSYDFNGPATIYFGPLNNPYVKEYINVFTHNILFNMDLLVNFINTNSFSMGVFTGFGLGYAITTWNNGEFKKDFSYLDYNGFNIPINVGISATFAEVHRIELGGKIQTLAPGYVDKTRTITRIPGLRMHPYIINIGYSYTF